MFQLSDLANLAILTFLSVNVLVGEVLVSRFFSPKTNNFGFIDLNNSLHSINRQIGFSLMAILKGA